MRLCRRHIESRTGSPIVNKETQKKMPARRSRQSFHQFALLAAAAMALLAFVAAPAAAAPSLAVKLDRDEARFPIVRHGDERVDYTLAVGNVATVESGAELTCNPEAWSGSSPSFAYQWLRDGADISGAEAAAYTLQPADDEAVIQCRVTATNGVEDTGGGFAGSTRTTGSLLVEPPSGTPMPPVPPSSIGAPGQSGSLQVPGPSVDRTLTCNPSVADWTAVTEPLEFQWYRNGIAIPGANEQTYAIAAGSLTSRAAFQCAVTGRNDVGSVTSVSAIRNTSPAPSPAAPNNNNTLFLSTPGETSDPTSGLVTAELELPEGASAFRLVNPSNLTQTPVGWTCDNFPPSGAIPARVLCTRSDVLTPGQAYPGIGVVARLGDDMPDVATATAVAYGGGSPAPVGDNVQYDLAPALPFGLSAFDAEVLDEGGNDYTQAGGHPFVGIGTFEFNKKRVLTGEHFDQLPLDFAPVGQVRQVVTDLPRGFVGNALAVPQLCATVQQVRSHSCPVGSRVGGIELQFGSVGSGGQLQPIVTAIYAIEPEFGTPAQFAFFAGGQGLFTLSARLRPDDGYGISLELAPAPQLNLLYSKATICDWGTNLVGEEITCKGPEDAGANPKPLFANPTRCGSPPPIARAHLDSWQNPGADDEQGFPDYSDPDWKTYEAANPEVTGCEQVDFDPGAVLEPSTAQADSASGLDIELTMPTNGLEGKDDEGNRDPEAISQANVKRAEIAFPPGMAVNASAAEGLGACSTEQIKLGTNAPVECPDSSKIGTVEIETPIIEDKLEGGVYIAEQGDVDGSLIGLYMVFDSPENGILIKIPGKVEPQPDGQLVAVVDEIPDAPFSTAKLHFPGGPFATLLTPPKCGSYEIETELVPWSGGKPVIQKSPFEVTSGPGGGACPTDALLPTLQAGVSSPLAGQVSPFVVRLSREDGTDRFTALSLKAPQGLVAYLKGVPYCADAVLAAIPTAEGTGQDEIDDPSCPAQSQIGRVVVGAGAGASPFYTEAPRAYLAGPYKGAPLSIAVVAPAVAGPLDLGNVVVRNAVYVDPATAEISVVSDPIPHILHGLLLNIRDVRVLIDRPGFTLNPSGCEAKQVGADVKGLETAAIVSLANHFQVGNCAALGFKPRVALRLFGGTNRGDYQGVRAVVRPRPGDSNISRTVVRFPRSAFVAQEHIRTVCTRVQYAADACPKGSVYGKAVAWSPLLDHPLRGNVYLRSSDNTLPDAVADLRGPAHQPIRVEVAIRNDSVKGALRNTVQAVPDAPVSYFRLQLLGKDKGLIVNSRNICKGANRAAVGLRAHNGRRALLRPKVFNKRCGKQGKKRRGEQRRRRATG
jgi:hypothetical protein